MSETINIKPIIRRLILFDNYHLSKVTLFCEFTLKTLRKQPLLVYQMGKVGSSTVERSLQNSSIDMPIFQFHMLSDSAIRFEEKTNWGSQWGSNWNLFRKSLLPVTKHLYYSYYFRWLHNRGKPNSRSKWKIVTLVREPVVRNISGFFESITFLIPDFYMRMQSGSIELNELKNCFLQKYWHNKPLTWFDEELKAVLGVDVYSEPFPKSKGYKIYNEESVDLLLIRLENLSECYTEAFREFLGLDVRLEEANLAGMKTYAPYYREFTKSVPLPNEYLDWMYCSKYATHFYDQHEISRFRQRWSG